ncbi:TetR/AcrR family transcriptional regulator [Deinococcus sp. HMF7604]|uniref:TetR/AcrR family transcriptional regulator n=1 Tax=Deinococcus betulae TaxID=2873312 RepID=UPI001CCA456B|nr:TetR/AcrR family transcriptional regulator [Deinococcus betulae]
MTASPARRLPSADRRQQLLSASEALFTVHGFEAVSMGDIAVALGISRPTVYSYFASTADLLSELLEGHLADLERRLVPLLTGTHTQRPLAAIFQLLVGERALLTLLGSGSGPTFAARRLAVLAGLEERLSQSLHPPEGRTRTPYLLTCVTLLLQATATHAVTAGLSPDQTAQLAGTLERFVNAGLQGLDDEGGPARNL